MLDASSNLPPNATPEAVSCMLMGSRGEASGKSFSCHEQSWRLVIKFSILIDNLIRVKTEFGKAYMAAGDIGKQGQRRAAMAVLAHSDAADIAGRLGAIAVPPYEDMREPENGLVMVRGRIGGDGAPFNLARPRCRGRWFGFRPARWVLATRSAVTGRRRG